MKNSSFAIAAAVAIVALSGSAYAADSDQNSTSKPLTLSDGWYASGSAGLAFMDTAHSHSSSGSVFDVTGADPGYDLTAALGKTLGSGFRGEAELGYHRVDLGSATVYRAGALGLNGHGAGGDASAVSMMGNGYYDFDTGGPFKPYIGAGIGLADVNFNGVDIGGRRATSDDDLAFAYQAMAGIGYQLTPTGTIFTGYRYFAVDDPTFGDNVGGSLHSEFATHNVELGYRLSF
jgi:opacity protein-like surface antigen